MLQMFSPSGRGLAAGWRRVLVLLVCFLLVLQSLVLTGWTGRQIDIFDNNEQKQVKISNWYFGYLNSSQKQLQENDKIIPLPGAWFWPGLKLSMAGGVPVAAEIAGHDLWSQAPAAGHVLAQESIALGPYDRVETNLGSSDPYKYIRIIRVEKTVEVKKEEVPPPLVRRPDRYVALGKEKLVQEGKAGVRCLKYLVTKENGKEVGRELVDSWIEVQPQPRVLAYGSRAYPEVTARAGDTLKVVATAYTHTGNRTATGIWPHRGIVAVDPRVIPLGTRLYVEGYGYAVAQDTGGLIKGNRIDVFLDSEEEAINWGRRTVTVKILGK